MKMNPFYYYREKSEKLHLITQQMMIDILNKTGEPLAAMSGYEFSIASPHIAELDDRQEAKLDLLLNDRYKTELTRPHFGQAHTTLKIYKVKNEK